jgi:hypothetical protein
MMATHNAIAWARIDLSNIPEEDFERLRGMLDRSNDEVDALENLAAWIDGMTGWRKETFDEDIDPSLFGGVWVSELTNPENYVKEAFDPLLKVAAGWTVFPGHSEEGKTQEERE